MKVVTTPTGILEYASPRTTEPVGRPGPIVATLLHLPGTYCWFVLASMNLGWWHSRATDAVFSLAAVAWPIAVLTAVISLAYLPGGWQKPWYVWVNLLTNISGLLFTGFIVWLMVWH